MFCLTSSDPEAAAWDHGNLEAGGSESRSEHETNLGHKINHNFIIRLNEPSPGLTLSPTPPVLCLSSTRSLHSSGHSRLTPLPTMALVSQAVSWGQYIMMCYDMWWWCVTWTLRPCIHVAMSQAPNWASLTSPATSLEINTRISSSLGSRVGNNSIQLLKITWHGSDVIRNHELFKLFLKADPSLLIP